MSDKTEQPTPKRLRESREKGDVCKSQDVPSALTVLALSVYIVVMGGHLLESLLAMMELPMKLLSTPYAEAAPRAAEATFHVAVSIVAPLVGLVMAVALVANLGQVGILFAFKGAMPKLENVSPSKWFQKVFSMKNLVEFLKNIIKVTVLGVTVWVVMRDHLPTLFAIQRGTIWTMWEVLGMAVKDLLLMAAGVFCVIAAVDYLFQKWQYTKNHMMSKDEVKREYKEMEGDPQVKGKRKQLHQEMLSQRAGQRAQSEGARDQPDPLRRGAGLRKGQDAAPGYPCQGRRVPRPAHDTGGAGRRHPDHAECAAGPQPF